MTKHRDSVDVSDLNAFQLQSSANTLKVVDSVGALEEALDVAIALNEQISIVGEGTNSIFTPHLDAMLLKMAIRGIVFEESTDGRTAVRVGAGENWHAFVMQTVEQSLWGLENLALIPGSVGAAPVQNIGAYGVEVSELIETIIVYDVQRRCVDSLKAEECGFSYRESHFKRQWRDRYVILEVVFLLQTAPKAVLTYGPLAALETLDELTPRIVAETVIETRRAKLPDPTVLPNAGSYFKNPIVSVRCAERLLESYPQAPHWSLTNGVKFAAGWMIERCGLRGVPLEGGVTPYQKQALVLTNPNSASYEQLMSAERWIVAAVASKFEVELEREPQRLHQIQLSC